jgi:hypothetical protein
MYSSVIHFLLCTRFATVITSLDQNQHRELLHADEVEGDRDLQSELLQVLGVARLGWVRLLPDIARRILQLARRLSLVSP